jgi:hypothetical protein
VTDATVTRYLRLGLRLDRHVEGMVDAYYGPPGLAAEVAAEPQADPAALVAEAEALLAEVEDGWLRDQLAGVRAFAGVLAGEPVAYADEVERCYGIRPVRTDEAVFEAAHERLDALLPGGGPLAERLERWRASMRLPAGAIEGAMAAAIEEARARARRLVELPEGEAVELELVRDEPWWAFCEYLGGLRSRISVNTDLPMSGLDLLHVAIHETYPGHHAERSCKEQLLVRGRGLLEETIVLVPTPQSLVAEGIAELAVELLLDGDAGPALAAVVHDAGIELDLPRARAVERAREALAGVEVNAALMLHADGAEEADVQAYVERWALATPELAAHTVRFATAPASRSYMPTYAAGHALCRAYVGGEPARFRRLLTEQVRVGELLAALPERTVEHTFG